MAGERKLVVEVVGDTRSLQRALGRGSREIEGFGKTASRAGKVAGLAAGAAGIGALTFAVKTGIGEWMQSNKVAAQTAAVLKSTGGAAGVTAKHVDSLATSIMNYSGIDDEAIKSTENLLLAYTGVRNEVGKGNDVFDRATKVITDYSVRTGKGAAGATQVFGKALNEIAQGQVPKTIRGVGKLSDGLVKQMQAMVKAGNVTGAQSLLLKTLEERYGGAAKAAGDTLPGQLNIAREKFNNFAGDLVTKVIPSLKQAISWLKDHWPEIKAQLLDMWASVKPILTNLAALFDALWPVVKKAFDIMLPMIKDMARVVSGMVEVVTGLLSGDFSKVWAGIGDIVGGAIQGVLDRVSAMGQLLWLAFKGPFDSLFVTPFTTAWTTVANWFGTAEGFVAKVAGYIGGLPAAAWAKFTAVFTAIFVTPFKNAFNAVADWIIGPDGFVTKAAGFVGSLPSRIADFGGALLDRIKGFFEGAQIGGWIGGKVQEFADYFTGLPGKIADFSKELVTKLTGIIEHNNVTDYLKGVPGKFAEFFKDLPSAIGNAALSGVKAGLSIVGRMIDGLFGKLGKWVRGILGINSPSKEFEQVGQYIVEGLVKGLESGGFGLKDAVVGLIKEYVIKAGMDAFTGWTSDMWDEVQKLGDIFGDIFGGIGGAAGGALHLKPGPYSGTHETLGLPGYPAIDQFAPSHSLVYPPDVGHVSKLSGRPWSEGWSSGPGSAIGLSMYLATKAGDYFLTHFEKIFKSIGDLVVPVAPIGLVGPMSETAGGVSSHIHSGFHAFAKGGIVTRPTYGLVGESGPEAVIPLRGGGLGGPSVINVVLDGKQIAQVVRRENGRYTQNNALGGLT